MIGVLISLSHREGRPYRSLPVLGRVLQPGSSHQLGRGHLPTQGFCNIGQIFVFVSSPSQIAISHARRATLCLAKTQGAASIHVAE